MIGPTRHGIVVLRGQDLARRPRHLCATHARVLVVSRPWFACGAVRRPTAEEATT
jgi:hypothetical protein